MASIGPQLPPHLQKRKRESAEEATNSPPPKQTRRTNEDEIDLHSDSDDDYGPKTFTAPSSPPVTGHPESSIGPAIPAAANQDEINLDDSEDDFEAGPASIVQSAGPAIPSALGPIIGPTLPPGPLDAVPTTDPHASEDTSDSEDDFGPALPSATAPSSAYASSTTTNAQSMRATTASQPAAKRDDWMLAPPISSGPRAPDPTKLKARGFASGRAAGARGSGEISSIWTETPEEKAQRLKDAVLGRSDPGAAVSTGCHPSAPVPRDEVNADDERIRSYTEKTRGKSLYEEHQARKKTGEAAGRIGEEEDDPSKRAFDKEKDMSIGGGLSNAQRREMLNKAANFGGRFQKGSYL